MTNTQVVHLTYGQFLTFKYILKKNITYALKRMTGPWEGTVQAVPPQMAPARQSRNLKKKKKKKG